MKGSCTTIILKDPNFCVATHLTCLGCVHYAALTLVAVAGAGYAGLRSRPNKGWRTFHWPKAAASILPSLVGGWWQPVRPHALLTFGPAPAGDVPAVARGGGLPHLRRLRGPTESKAQNTILSAESFFIPFMGPLPFFNLGKTYTQRKERGLRFFY